MTDLAYCLAAARRNCHGAAAPYWRGVLAALERMAQNREGQR